MLEKKIYPVHTQENSTNEKSFWPDGVEWPTTG